MGDTHSLPRFPGRYLHHISGRQWPNSGIALEPGANAAGLVGEEPDFLSIGHPVDMVLYRRNI